MVNIALFTNTERTIKSFFYLESTEKQELYPKEWSSAQIRKERDRKNITEKKQTDRKIQRKDS